MSDAKAAKAKLRLEIVARILAMDPDDRRAQEAALVDRLESLPGFSAAKSILLYASAFAEEIDTRPMLWRTLEAGKRLILPRVDRTSRSLTLLEVNDLDGDLVAGHRGIPEPRRDCVEASPEAVDWVLVPGVAFDTARQRLGRGAGHYDRLLPRLRVWTPRWALILDSQWVDDLPVEPHDQPLDGLADWKRLVSG